MSNANSEFEQVTTNDYPEEKPRGEFAVTKETEDGELDVEIEFQDGCIRVDASGAHSFSTKATKTIEQGEFGIDCGRTRLGDEESNLIISIPETIYAELEQLETELKEWEEEARTWIESHPLRFRVEEHQYKTGTWRTKYTVTSVVLKPNKSEQTMSDDEQRFYEALKGEYGEADGYPSVEDRFDVGDVLRRDDLSTESVRERVDEITEQQREKERWEEIVDEHPELHGAAVSSDEVEEAFEAASRDGDREKIATKVTRCSEPSYECNIDHVHLYATPSGEVDTSRIHTH